MKFPLLSSGAAPIRLCLFGFPFAVAALAPAVNPVLAAASAPPGPALRFGVQTHFGQGWPLTVVPRLAEDGIADVRDELFWELVEPTAGRFVFPPAYDAYMAALKTSGINPLIELTFENSNYDGGQTPWTDAGRQAYARYATALLDRYGRQIEALEVWNEYNGSFAKGPVTADRAGYYFKMLQAAYVAIKAVRPDVTVVGGATAGVPLPYFEKLFAAGALDCLDAVSVHPYRFDSPPEGLEVQIAALRDLMTKYGEPKPIWVTEIGWYLHAPAAAGDLNIDEATQAKFLIRAFALLASAGVSHVYWYDFRDDETGPPMGLVQNSTSLVPRQSFAAMKVLNTVLRPAAFVRRESSRPTIYSLLFATPSGQELRVLWALAPATVLIPAGTRVVDYRGLPVPTPGGVLPVTDAPFFVTGPLRALPGSGTAAPQAITDSASAFSLQQGQFGWQYGYFLGTSTAFQPLRQTQTTDWDETWTDNFPYISISSVDQHPSKEGGEPVTVVRRWTSPVAATLHLHVRFKVGTQGDGVRVRVLVNGRTLYADPLNTSTTIARDYDFERTVPSGCNFDFAVDPGPAADINYDATEVAVTVERLGP